jgi:hypothetical protein
MKELRIDGMEPGLKCLYVIYKISIVIQYEDKKVSYSYIIEKQIIWHEASNSVQKTTQYWRSDLSLDSCTSRQEVTVNVTYVSR